MDEEGGVGVLFGQNSLYYPERETGNNSAYEGGELYVESSLRNGSSEEDRGGGNGDDDSDASAPVSRERSPPGLPRLNPHGSTRTRAEPSIGSGSTAEFGVEPGIGIGIGSGAGPSAGPGIGLIADACNRYDGEIGSETEFGTEPGIGFGAEVGSEPGIGYDTEVESEPEIAGREAEASWQSNTAGGRTSGAFKGEEGIEWCYVDSETKAEPDI